MEIYSSLKEVVNSIDFRIIYWEFQDSDNVFDRNALLTLADELEPTFNPEGLNYYMARPDGEILLLLMREKQIMSLFVPYEPQGQAGDKKPEAPPEPASGPKAPPAPGPKAAAEARFCMECGAPLRPGAKFCPKCGQKTQN